MGSWLFGGKSQSNARPSPPAASLRVQSSVQGKAIGYICGKNRAAGNILWYGDFKHIAVQQSSGGGGKGGGSAPSDANVTYNYETYVAIGVAQGPIAEITKVWDSHGVKTPEEWQMLIFLGADDQAPWGYLTTKHPDQALNYRNIAYVAFEPIKLGSSPDLPNLSFEIKGTIADGAPGIPDANVKDVVYDVLTNPLAGVSFPANRIGTLQQLFNYSAATGLLVSPVLVEQQEANRFLGDLAQGCNFEFRWSNGLLDAVPYGDTPINTGDVNQSNEDHFIPATPFIIQVDHGASFVMDIGVKRTSNGQPFVKKSFLAPTLAAGEYKVNTATGQYMFAAADEGVDVTISYTWATTASFVPDNTPIYNITDDDILPPQGGSGASGTDMEAEPVSTTLKRPSDILNIVRVEYLDRSNDYNPVAIDRKDEASILAYRPRPSDVRAMHFFALASAADQSATLQLIRESIPGTYEFTLPAVFILVDVLDLMTLTRPDAGWDRFAIRINEMIENADGTFNVIAEDFLGTASAPIYDRQKTSGYVPNANVEPGPVNEPIIFEPTAELLGGADLAIWAAISGTDPINYGGCNVYASFDGPGGDYAYITQARGPARMGVLTSPLPAYPDNPTEPTIDAINTLAVDLAQSHSELLPGTNADIAALATACYVDGEIIAYRDADLTAQYNYDLSYLARGAYGTSDVMEAGPHPAGSKFARLDMGIAQIAFDKSRIGQTVYLKFQAFNPYGGGLENLADCPSYSYVITGKALTSALPSVANLRLVTTDLFQEMWWDDVVDFRTGVRYKVFRGSTFAGAQQVADVAHAPIVGFGEGTFWVVAYCQPVPSLYVYSENPVSIEISGNLIVENLVYSSNQAAAGWPGVFSPTVAKSGVNISLSGAGDILGIPDFLNTPDILHFGGVAASGYYEIGPADYVNCHYVATAYVNASLKAVGVPVGQNILTIDDILAQPDILGSASTQFINAKIQIAIAQSEDPGDLYDAGDLYDVNPDLYTYGIQWSDWQDFVPGVYRGWMFKLRVVLESVDPNTVCTVIDFSFEVSVPGRADHYPHVSVPGGPGANTTIVFEPDDASSPSPFNGGPPVGGVANQALPVYQFQWSGLPGIQPVVEELTLDHMTFHFEDGSGNRVAVDPVSVTVVGF